MQVELLKGCVRNLTAADSPLYLQRTKNAATLLQPGKTSRSDTKLPYLEVKPKVSLKWKILKVQDMCFFFNYSSTEWGAISSTKLYDATTQGK